jgi:hypothetical protein
VVLNLGHQEGPRVRAWLAGLPGRRGSGRGPDDAGEAARAKHRAVYRRPGREAGPGRRAGPVRLAPVAPASFLLSLLLGLWLAGNSLYYLA